MLSSLNNKLDLIELVWDNIRDGLQPGLAEEISDAIAKVRVNLFINHSRALEVVLEEQERFSGMIDGFRQGVYPLGVFCMGVQYGELAELLREYPTRMR